MYHEAPITLPLAVHYDKAIFPPAFETPSPPHPDDLPDMQQVKAAEAVFAAQEQAQEQESHVVGGLLGLWTSTMLLHDLAIETFSEPAGEFEAEQEKRKNKPLPKRPEQGSGD
jgi:hypothetical protein